MSGLPIILESDDEVIFATLDLPRGRVVFSGGLFASSSWNYHTPDVADRIVSHFEAYCIASHKRPSFHRWCRRLVVSNLAMTLRNLAIDSIEAEWQGKYLRKYEMKEKEQQSCPHEP